MPQKNEFLLCINELMLKKLSQGILLTFFCMKQIYFVLIKCEEILLKIHLQKK